MKNGTYEYKRSITNTELKVVIKNGIIRMWEVCSVNGLIKQYDYRGVISEEQLKMYDFVKEVKLVDKWNLEYWIGGKKKETIIRGVNYGLAMMKKNEVKKSSHKVGLLMIVRAAEM